MYAVLGDVEFELITYFDGMEAQFGMDYAEHALIECLGEALWRAQRNGGAIDAELYLEAVRRAAGR